MNERDFVIWMNGFVRACHPNLPTHEQWDKLVDTLNNVETSSIKKSIFDSEKKTVFDIGHVKVPKEYWKTEVSTNNKQLLND